MKRIKISLTVLSAVLFFTSVATGQMPGSNSILNVIPGEALFCARINNFDYTLGQMDQFIAGAVPIPMGVSMMSRMQLAGLLCDAELKNVNTAGSFAIFGVVLSDNPSESNPVSNMLFVAGLIPVSDYKKFVSENPYCSSADAKGISKITRDPNSVQGKAMLCTQVGDFALVCPASSYDKLAAAAKSILDAKAKGIASVLEFSEVEKSNKEPVWFYGNIQQAYKVFGPTVRGKIEEAKKAMEQMKAQGQGAMGNPEAVMDMYSGLFDALATQTKYVSIAVKPSPNVLTITSTLSAMGGTDMAEMLATDTVKRGANRLLGYLEDGAVMNVSGRVSAKLNTKAMEFFVTMICQDMSEEDKAKMKSFASDVAVAFGGNDAMTFSIDPNSKSPFVGKYVIEIEDKDKINKVIDDGIELFNTGGIADFYKKMGMETGLVVTRGVAKYRGMSIDSAKLSMKSTDPNSPEGKMIAAMYGEGFDYRWAIVDKLYVCTFGGDVDSAIRKLIDQVKSGRPAAISSEVKSAMALLEDSDKADIIATYNYLRLFKIIGAMVPMPIPQMDFPTKSNIAIAGKIGGGKVVVDAALPKEHLMEMMTAFQMMQQKMMEQQKPQGCSKSPQQPQCAF